MSAVNTLILPQSYSFGTPNGFVFQPTTKKFSFRSNYEMTDFSQIKPKVHYVLTIPEVSSPALDLTQRIVTPLNQELSVVSKNLNNEVISPLLMSSADILNDIADQVQGAFKISNLIFETENPESLEVLGFTNIFNLASGALNIYEGIADVETAEKVSDVFGKHLGALKVARGTATSIAATFSTVAVSLSISALATASKILKSVSSLIGTIGASVLSFSSFLNTIYFGLKLDKLRIFREEFYQILNGPEDVTTNELKAFEYLKSLVSLSAEEKLTIQRKIEEKCAQTPMSISAKNGLIEEEENRLISTKHAHVSRILNDSCLKLIIDSQASDIKTVIEKIQSKSFENSVLDGFCLTLSLLSVALFICSFIFVSPSMLLVMTAISLAATTGLLSIDGYKLWNEFNNADPGRFDKLCIYFSTVLAFVVVSLVFYLSSGLVPLVVGVTFGVTWLIINGICLWRLQQNPALPSNQPLEYRSSAV